MSLHEKVPTWLAMRAFGKRGEEAQYRKNLPNKATSRIIIEILDWLPTAGATTEKIAEQFGLSSNKVSRIMHQAMRHYVVELHGSRGSIPGKPVLYVATWRPIV